MNRKPVISVIITSRNEEKHIENCLESIKNQSYPLEKLEICVVDNNSIDKTKEIAYKYTDKVFNIGPERSAQRNFGVHQTTGEYFLYLDADMILAKDIISCCVEKCIKENYGMLYIPEKIIGKGFLIKVRNFEREFYNSTVIDCARFLRRDIFLSVGGFDETLTGPEDWDLDRKIAEKERSSTIHIPLYHDEGEFNLKKYLQKKMYYYNGFDKYIKKWGKDDPIVKLQLGFWYRYFRVFTEKEKWKKLLIHPSLTLGMYMLRILVGLHYLNPSKRNPSKKYTVPHMYKNDLPKISIITVSLNCEKILAECYSRISIQDYPKDKIEILLIDGGSTDKTKEIAVAYGAKVINGGYRDNQEARRFIGFLHARNEILAYIDADNLLPEKNWLKKMVQPFLMDPEIIATQPLRYGYDSKQTIMNRYFALFGVNDPVAYYLGKADRLPCDKDTWNLLGDIIYETSDYYKICFRLDAFPTIGCNGFLVKRNVLEKLKLSPDNFFHIDVNYDLIAMGMNKYGIVKTDIIHVTSDSLFKSISKRLKYMQMHHQILKEKRRYKVFDRAKRKDVLNLIKFILFSCTIIKPVYDSIKGYRKIKDIAWFIHPLACIGFVFAYGYSTVPFFLKKKKNET